MGTPRGPEWADLGEWDNAEPRGPDFWPASASHGSGPHVLSRNGVGPLAVMYGWHAGSLVQFLVPRNLLISRDMSQIPFYSPKRKRQCAAYIIFQAS